MCVEWVGSEDISGEAACGCAARGAPRGTTGLDTSSHAVTWALRVGGATPGAVAKRNARLGNGARLNSRN